MKIGIIGAGWYGCHLALSLKKAGHDVTVYEKNSEIFSQISGSFGIRLHAGPHYPRSEETRKSCRRGFDEFQTTYPELVIPHEYSIYALGIADAEGNPSKVSSSKFKRVCQESESCEEVDLNLFGYQDLHNAYNIDEPSVALGNRLRSTFSAYLKDAGVKVICNYEIRQLDEDDSSVIMGDGNSFQTFDKVINATSYQAHRPDEEEFPFDMEVVYQPCLALMYKDTQPGRKPISFIVMDGWFPCLMPYICDTEDESNLSRNYILTHGKWTIMGSYRNPEQAKSVLSELDDTFVAKAIKLKSESEMARFWPGFSDRFEYIGWKGEVLAKLKTKCEFRSAVTYQKRNIIHIIPGKVSNIFDTEREVCALLNYENTIEKNGYLYIKGGVLDQSHEEITEKPAIDEANTANLRTFDELKNRRHRRQATRAQSYFFSQDHDDFDLEDTDTEERELTDNFFTLRCMTAIWSGLSALSIAIMCMPSMGLYVALPLVITGILISGYFIYRLTMGQNNESEINYSQASPS